jgi:ribosomal protein L37AE/L43A
MAVPVGVGGIVLLHHLSERRRLAPCPGCGARALERAPSGMSICQQCDATFPTVPDARLLR